jgi:hypothetical protein
MTATATVLHLRPRRTKVETEHHYNNPLLSSKEFLAAVKDDTTVPMALRTRAAELLQRIIDREPPPPPPLPEPYLIIRIGGINDNPTVEPYRKLLHAMWCYQNGKEPTINSLPVKP